ncbi:MAG: type II toxin-antitoxin system RelE/ParE family toxin [Kiloniellales bacterium]
MSWVVRFDKAFDAEVDGLPAMVQDELLAHARLIEQFGPTLGRPRVDTLNGSRHANMKELRFNAAKRFDAHLAGLTKDRKSK